MFGPDPQPTNIKHADNPEPGDYWHEMMTPIARVLMVDDQRVLIQKLHDRQGTVVTDTDPKPLLMTRRSFACWLRYRSIPDKTWAWVTPRKFAR